LKIASATKLNTIQEFEPSQEEKYVSIRGKSASKKVSKRKVVVSSGKTKKKSKSAQKEKQHKEKKDEQQRITVQYP
jgi:hypothetical protein